MAQNLYFEDESFLNYLGYLDYWKTPEYIKFISYPYCIPVLNLLKSEEFRMKLKNPAFCEQMAQQLWNIWQHSTKLEQLAEQSKEETEVEKVAE